MTHHQLIAVIEQHATNVEKRDSIAKFVFDGVELTCIYNTQYDRMRIISPVAREDAITLQHVRAAMLANFHTALDARYAISKGIVYAAFLHPMSHLSEAELVSAMRQVASLAKTFGTTFTSGELLFGAPQQQQPTPQPGIGT